MPRVQISRSKRTFCNRRGIGAAATRQGEQIQLPDRWVHIQLRTPRVNQQMRGSRRRVSDKQKVDLVAGSVIAIFQHVPLAGTSHLPGSASGQHLHIPASQHEGISTSSISTGPNRIISTCQHLNVPTWQHLNIVSSQQLTISTKSGGVLRQDNLLLRALNNKCFQFHPIVQLHNTKRQREPTLHTLVYEEIRHV